MLEAIAERLEAELIVVGRKGRSQIVAIAVGSVTDRLQGCLTDWSQASMPRRRPSVG